MAMSHPKTQRLEPFLEKVPPGLFAAVCVVDIEDKQGAVHLHALNDICDDVAAKTFNIVAFAGRGLPGERSARCARRDRNEHQRAGGGAGSFVVNIRCRLAVQSAL